MKSITQENAIHHDHDVSEGSFSFLPLVRPLAGTERALAVGNAHFQGNFDLVSVGFLRGPWSYAVLLRALEKVCADNPVLQLDVRENPERRDDWWFVKSSKPISLVEVERVDSTTWKSVWKAHCDSPVSGRSWCATWIRREGMLDSELVLGFNHAVADGRSLQIIFRQIVQACAYTQNDSDVKRDQVLMPAVLSASKARLSFKYLRDIGSVLLPWRLRLPPFNKQFVPPRDRRWLSEFRAVSSRNTKKLVERCRYRGITVGAAIGAAVRLAAAKQIGQTKVKLSFSDMVDLRDRLSPFTADTVGDIVVAILRATDIDPSDDLWKLAQKVQKQLSQDISSGMHLRWTLVPQFFGYRTQRLFAARTNGRSTSNAFLVSNIGRVDAIEAGDYQITRFFSTSKQVQWGSVYSLSVNTVGDHLSLHLGYASPMVGQQQASKLMDMILHLLGIDDCE